MITTTLHISQCNMKFSDAIDNSKLSRSPRVPFCAIGQFDVFGLTFKTFRNITWENEARRL